MLDITAALGAGGRASATTPGAGAAGMGALVDETAVGRQAAATSGATAQAVGAAREETVANISGGKVANLPIRTSIGSTDIDVIGANGELIGVGGPNKANNLGNLGNEIAKLQEYAKNNGGVPVQYYITDNTPLSVYNFLVKKLGADNVFWFKEK